jgi:amidase
VKKPASELPAPSRADVAAAAAAEGIGLAPGEAEELLPVVASIVAAAERAVAAVAAPLPPPVPAVRDPGAVPAPGDNPYNSFIRRCRVDAGAGGPLRGRTVGVKDNISVAGVPTTNGSALPPFTPAVDAVVVERVLLAGGVITGKLNMDAFGAAGLGETSAFGPARNPVDPARSAGGSSGGCGSAVRAGEVDLALAIDQGGSGRIPAAFCGVVAVKATHGLVPTFGVTHLSHTIDHVVPTARTVADAALLLAVIAGPDPRDPQVAAGPAAPARCDGAEGEGVAGLRIGIVEEASTERTCDRAVLEGLARAADALERAGARVERVSIPVWEHALAIFIPYIAHLAAETVRTEGEGFTHHGVVDVERMAGFARLRRTRAAELPSQVKAWLLAERHLRERGGGAVFGALHNRRLAVRRAIDAALARADLLLTPTLPMTAPRLAGPDASFAEVSMRTAERLCCNTAPLNLSGHPAITVPSGTDADGLPVAVQLVGRPYGEREAFRAAYALERAGLA